MKTFARYILTGVVMAMYVTAERQLIRRGVIDAHEAHVRRMAINHGWEVE